MRYMLLIYKDEKLWDEMSVAGEGRDLPAGRRVQ